MFVVPNVLLFIFLYLFYTLNYAEHYTLIAFTIAIFITVVAEALLIFELKPPKHNSPISTRELIKTASPMMFSGLMMYLLNWTDVIILGIMTDEKQVGIYNVAFKVGNVGLLVIISVSTIMMPRMAELYGQGDIAGLKKLVHTSTRLVSLLSIPITLFFLIFGSFVLSFFNAEAVQGTTALSIVALGVLASALAGNVDQILNMSNNATIFRNITIACFVINLVLNVVLIPVYGINGSAAASLVTNVLINIICIIYIKKKLGFYTW
jgi:O-antigen/teichoic acid export membrane protein